MKEELKKYLKDHECFAPLKVGQENYILLAIDRFFDQYQPERSKREDSPCSNCFELEKASGNCFSQDGFCSKCGRVVGCGALNTQVTE